MLVPGLRWGDSCNEATNSRLVCCFHLQPSLGGILSVIWGPLQETTRTIGELQECILGDFKWCRRQVSAILQSAREQKQPLVSQGLAKNKANCQMTLRFTDVEETFLLAPIAMFISRG